MGQRVIFGTLTIIILRTAALAHGGLELDLPQIPNGVISIDGSEVDWFGLDTSFKFDRSRLEADNGDPFPPRDDLDVTWWFGYTLPPENMLYAFARIQDNVLILDEVIASRYWTDDSLQLALDMDHSGGFITGNDLNEVANGQRYSLRILPIDGEPTAWNDQQQRVDIPALQWLTDFYQGEETEWFDIAWTVEPAGAEHRSTNVAWTWEFRCAVWDIVAPTRAESVRHTFSEFQVVHLALRILDADTQEFLTHRIHPIGAAGREALTNAETMTDWFTLDAADTDFKPGTAVERSSWGQIKIHLARMR